MQRITLRLLAVVLLGGCVFPGQQRQVTTIPDVVAPPVEQEESVAVSVAPDNLLPETSQEDLLPEVAEELPLSAESSIEESAAPPAKLPYLGDFPLATHPRVEKLYNYYTGNGRRHFSRWLERAGRYIPMIQKVFAEEGIPQDLAYLAMIESGFNVRAYSWAHAAGPWQFIESTAKLYGLQNDWWQDQRCDIELATHAAAKHLKYLYERFDGDWALAVAAYNAGGGKVRKAIRVAGSRDFWRLVEGKVLREETKNYLPKLLAALMVVKDLDAAGFHDLEIEEPISYDVVTIPSSTDLELVARLCEADYADIKALNPSLKRWSTPPGVSNYQLKIPSGCSESFNQQYAKIAVEQRARYHRHQIQPGDTLGKLAKKYHIQLDDIITLNNIKNPRALRVGMDLVLPLQENFTSLPVDSLADNYTRSRRKTYMVRSGDSLWKIARRFGVTEKQLRVWNRLGWSNLLRPGQKLAVSRPGRIKVARQPGPAKKYVYHVKPGDTLWDIGRQFDVELDMIRLWNDLSRGQLLQPGQKLTLMVPANQQG